MTETRPTQEDMARDLEPYAREVAEDDRRPWAQRRLAECFLHLAAENKALEERVRRARELVEGIDTIAMSPQHALEIEWAIRALAADDAKAAELPVAEPERIPPEQLERATIHGFREPTDDRADRRRAYVRDKAPVLMGALMRNEPACPSWDRRRKQAIEQAGLIFDETEQSE